MTLTEKEIYNNFRLFINTNEFLSDLRNNNDLKDQLLNYVFKEIFDIKRKAEKLGKHNRENFSRKQMTEKLKKILDIHLKDLPTQVGLNLPKLKKSNTDETSEAPSVKLPKLTKG